MDYLGELRVNWRYVTAAAIGLGGGHIFNMYLGSLFAPHLLQAFGWTKAQFALIGMTILIGAVFMPIAGRLTDKLGTRKAATIGVIASPILYLALATMTGSFPWFLALNALQLMLVGSFTTTMVYNRLIAGSFARSRGLALGVTACAPAITAAAAAPLLNRLIDAQGWRAGYVALAIIVALAGAIALLLIPKGGGDGAGRGRTIAHDYTALMRDRAFQILSLSKLLGSISLMVLTTQLKLVLLDHAMGSESASLPISLFAVATIGGRFFGGIALDRFASHIVGFLGYGLIPAIGFVILGAGVQNPALLAGAVLILGLAFGADGNITAYLVMRHFRFEIFSTVYSLISVAIALSAAGGALLLSLTLKASGGFSLFFLIAAALVFAAGALILPLGRQPPAAAPAG